MRSSIPALLVLGACGGQFGEEDGGRCEIASETPLAMDEVSDLFGFAGQDLADLVGTSHELPFVWADDTTTTLTLTLANVGNARVQDWESVDVDPTSDIDLGCEDVLAIDADVGFATADGAFAETWALTLGTSEATRIDVFVELDEVAGTFDVSDWADDEYEEMWAHAGLEFREAGVSGDVTGVGQQTQGSGDDGTVSATEFPIALFGGDIE